VRSGKTTAFVETTARQGGDSTPYSNASRSNSATCEGNPKRECRSPKQIRMIKLFRGQSVSVAGV